MAAGGGGDYADSEQTESLNENTGGEDIGDYAPNEESRGVSAGCVKFILIENADHNYTSILYGRKVEGTNADGSKKMGKWVQLIRAIGMNDPTALLDSITKGTIDVYENRGDKTFDFNIPDEFAEFGFEFHSTNSTDYPYSGIFWTVDRGKAKKISIDQKCNVGLGVDKIKIEVNDKEIFNDDSCYSHKQYDWNAEDKITVRTTKTKNYLLNVTRFYARKSAGAEWERIIDTTEGYNIAYVPSDYVEFGFEFNISSGTKWPYSGMFWGAEKAAELKSKGGKVEDINIEMTGAVRYANIYIYVNSHKEVSQEGCSQHTQYDWGTGPGLSAPTKLNVLQRGAFATSDMNFYGRKAGGKWEKLFSFGNSGGEKTVPDEYIDFGFEFYPGFAWASGDKWPYSQPFWIAEEHPGCSVKSISITVGGYLSFFGSTHIDITVQGYDANGGYSLLYPYSNHDLDDTSPNKWEQYSW